MRGILRCLIILALPWAIGCSKGDPNFDTLSSERVPRPLFDGQTLKVLDIASMDREITVNGECDPRIEDILIKLPGEQGSFNKLNSSSGATDASVTCSTQCRTDGKGCFTFKLAGLKALNKNVNPKVGQVFEIEVRGLTAGGISASSVIKITYSLGAANNRIVISSGATQSGAQPRYSMDDPSNPTIKAEIRVSNKILDPTLPNSQRQFAQSGDGTIKARFSVGVPNNN